MSVDWLSIFRFISDDAIRKGVCEREKNRKSETNCIHSDINPSNSLNRLKWAALAVLNPISHFERCNSAIRQLAQREGEEGAGQLSGGFTPIKHTERVDQEDQTLKRVIIQSHSFVHSHYGVKEKTLQGKMLHFWLFHFRETALMLY